MLNTLAAEDPRVAKMMELEGLFRSDPYLWSDYMSRERERLDYQAELRAREARGEKRGEALGILKALAGLVRDGILSLAGAASRMGMTEDEFTAKMAAL